MDRRIKRFLLPALFALALGACADAGIDRAESTRRLTSGEITLDPESARTMINAYRARKGLRSTTGPKLTLKPNSRRSRATAR